MALRNLLLMTKEMRMLLQKKGATIFIRTQPKSNITPPAGWFGDLFKMHTIMIYWEVIPVIVSAAFAAVLPIVHTGFMIYKANEIRFWPGKKMLLEKHQYIIDGPKPVCQKYICINQKYEWPCGLLQALKEDDSCEDENAKKLSFKFWKKDIKSSKPKDK